MTAHDDFYASELIAAAIHAELDAINQQSADTIAAMAGAAARRMTVRDTASRIAAAMALANPAFNIKRFIAACGF